ncbi:MAG: GHMP kinase [Flavobacteriales bacterium]|nr:GHMP kinase [Flavobacteriales bacterium]MDW8410985.1 GHMP kinase [Flavobacteriales bacterium]
MVISRTPFRISFVGGGSDIPDFYQRYEGAVVSATINQYMYITTHRFFEPHQIRAKYSITETVDHPAELRHPIIRTVLMNYNILGGLEISSLADIPAGTGMGSSSSFTVGLIHNIRHWLKLPVDKEILASEACQVEIEQLREPIGRQDQYAAAYGGFNKFCFHAHHRVETVPLVLEKALVEELEKHLLLLFTGVSRSASAVLQEQKKVLQEDDSKFEVIREMVSLTEPFVEALKKGDFEQMGRLLHQNWLLKKSLTVSISDAIVDKAYEAALKAGVWGGKLLGAGGGGFLLLMGNPLALHNVEVALNQFRKISFNFEFCGSTIIYDGREKKH